MELKPLIQWDQAEVIEDGNGGWEIKFRGECGNEGVISSFKSRIGA